jgi:hypothetical protein
MSSASFNPLLVLSLPILKNNDVESNECKNAGQSSVEKSIDHSKDKWSLFLFLLNSDRTSGKVGMFNLVKTSSNREELVNIAGIILTENICPVVRIQKNNTWKWIDTDSKGSDDEYIDYTLDDFTNEERLAFKKLHIESFSHDSKESTMLHEQNDPGTRETSLEQNGPEMIETYPEEKKPGKGISEKKGPVKLHTSLWIKALAIKARQDDIKEQIQDLQNENQVREEQLHNQLQLIYNSEKEHPEVIQKWIKNIKNTFRKNKKETSDTQSKKASINDLITDIKELSKLKNELMVKKNMKDVIDSTTELNLD